MAEYREANGPHNLEEINTVLLMHVSICRGGQEIFICYNVSSI